MRLRPCFIALNYLLCALGLACLALAKIFPDWLAAAVFAALGACCVLELRGALPLATPPWFALWKLVFPLLLVFYALLDLTVLEILTAFLVTILFTRLLVKTELNDYLYGHMTAIVCLLIGAVYIRDLIFGALFLAFYLVLCWALILYNLYAERVGSGAPPERFKATGGERLGAAVFWLSGVLMLASLALTAVIFIAFPRVGLGFLSLTSESSPVSGFSERVKLGDVGRIKLNQQVVMRVEFSKDGRKIRPFKRYLWRGVALDHYDGEAWTSTAGIDLELPNPHGRGVEIYAAAPAADIMEHEVFMESFDSNIIFTHGVPLRIDGSFHGLTVDGNFVIRTTDEQFGPRKFRLTTDNRGGAMLLPAPLPKSDEFLRRFLQLPGMSGNIAALSGGLAAADDAPAVKAQKLLAYFDRNFRYSLDMTRVQSGSAIEDFLLRRKAGHCEYFAAAMVILLRLQGVPARMVNGFAGEEWNDLGQYMVIRQQHAHSWVEAYLPERGWTVYDPTPPDPAMRAAAALPRLSMLLDLMRLTWQRYVIRYSFQDQVRLAHFFGSESRSLANRFSALKNLTWGGVAAMLKNPPPWAWGLVAIPALWPLVRRLARGGRQGPPPDFAVTLYLAMLRRLEKRGLAKKPEWTPREFLARLAALPAETRTAAERLTAFYEEARFGCRHPAAAEKQAMQQLLQHM